ncbi:MAG: hypothetical protein V1493_06660 [Candidatus Diapherotrites archaeon]
MEGFTKRGNVVIPKRTQVIGKTNVSIARMREELEAMDPNWLRDTMVEAVEIDRLAIGITYPQHVEMLRKVLEKARKGEKPSLPGQRANESDPHKRI